MNYLKQTLLIGLLGIAALSVNAQSFNSATDQAKADLKASLVELAQVREDITAEKIPLIRSVSNIEDQVIRQRDELDRLRRLRDNSDLGLNRLREQVESMQEQNEYAAGLLDEFVRSFETRIDYSETQLYAQAAEDARLALDDSNMSQAERFQKQLEVIGVALERMDQLVGGYTFEGRALAPNGEIEEGRYAVFGPTVYFASKQSELAGLTYSKLNAAVAAVAVPGPEFTAGIRAFVEDGEGTIPADATLGKAIEAFFNEIRSDGRLQQLVHRHYSHVDSFNYSDIRTFTERIQTHLPRYRDLFREEAANVGIDWRLLAAIGYQESLWNEKARSPTGVRGLMMLTRATAKQMGIKNRLDPAQSIRGGAKYFMRVLKKIPQRIAEPDRTWFALASYNVGFGHLEDARKITEARGGDPDRWIDVKQSLPLLARKKWYKDTKFGYARGWEPVIYVENIRQYYDYLAELDNRALREREPPKPLPQAAPLAPSL